MRRPRLVYVVTHPVTADVLLRGQLTFMRERGFDVSVVSAPGPELDRVREREGVETVAVPMVRNNDAKADVVSLARMVRAFQRLRPDIVNAGTPKAGLLGMMAARALSVPVRIYLLRGLRLETVHGLLRPVLAATERIASTCAHDVACVSPSLRDVSVAGGYVSKRKATIIGAGSSNGVDTSRFQRTPELRAEGSRLLESLGVPADAPLVGFVGRLVADKGIAELLDAFALVKRQVPRAKLVLLGGDLGDEIADPLLVAKVRAADGVVATPKIRDLAPHYARIDVLAFPSFREGFPNVVMEAASAEVPVVGFRSTGVVDGIVHGVTGAIVDQRDVKSLARELFRYLESPKLAAEHGRAARMRTDRLFKHDAVWRAWFEAYSSRLEARGLPVPRS